MIVTDIYVSYLRNNMEFLAEENDCGQTVLRLVSRGSAIIAELLRLSTNIPGIFLGSSYVEDPEQLKYLNVLFDFSYLRNPEDFETKINSNPELLDLDDEFINNHQDILDRFYQLFDGIYKYIHDYLEFLENLEKGYFIQHTIENILLDTDGAQLMCECLFLYGVMLLLLDQRIPGPCRERMIIAYFRNKGESALENIDHVCKLCRVTGYIPSTNKILHPKPPQYPERYFKRFQPPIEVINMIIGKLQSDDIYLQEPNFPHRDHRSTRLATQASMLYVIAYFAPDILIHERATMREIVDRHFNDNFIITIYMGNIADLSYEWAPYPAAKAALQNTLEIPSLSIIIKNKAEQMTKSINEINLYLAEGVLNEEYVLENLDTLLNSIRFANVTIRWTMLHSRMQQYIPMMVNTSTNNTTSTGKEQRFLFEKHMDSDKLITLLLKCSTFEWKLKNIFSVLLKNKETKWENCIKETAVRMIELSDYFTGDKPLTRGVIKNNDLTNWFSTIADKVKTLDYSDHIKAGRRIKKLIEALKHVEQFDQIDTSLQVKAYLSESRNLLNDMVKTVRVRDEIMGIIENISDLSYAWEVINDFMKILHQRVKTEPNSVILLRAVFLKLASIMDIPLARIHQCHSDDVISVAEYYSSELVDYVRKVMEIIPQSVFRILNGIVNLQNQSMKVIPVKIENNLLKEHAQLSERYKLARATNEVSKYTEGILAMKKTLLGIIEVDPKEILEEGLRKELVLRVSKAFHDILQFKNGINSNKNNIMKECSEVFHQLANTLTAYRLSFEYIQDYIGIYGLRIWHEEVSRIISYNVEQECNRYLKKKIYDRASQYQSKAIPIPRFQPPEGDNTTNFMGRLLQALFSLTDPHETIYSTQCLGWFLDMGPESSDKGNTNTIKEICGIATFSVLHSSIGSLGLVGLDKMLSFRIVHTLNNLIKFWNSNMTSFLPLLDQLTNVLKPEWNVPENGSKLYEAAKKKIENVMSKLLKAVLMIGQAGLIKKQISSELNFSSKLDAKLLSCTLDTLNKSLLDDTRKHYRDPKNKPYPGAENNPILTELNKYLDNTGGNDSYAKIYVTIDSPLEGLSAMLMLFVISYMPKLQYDHRFGALVRIGKNPIDGQPLVIGVLIILKQFHPCFIKQFFSYLGQYVRSRINEFYISHHLINKKRRNLVNNIEYDKNIIKDVTMQSDVMNCIFFLLYFVRAAKLSQIDLYNYIPAYIIDGIQIL